MSSHTRSINHFADAVGAALGLQELYGRFAAAAVLDDAGAIVDMRPFAGDSACVVCAIEWAVNGDAPDAERIVLLSGGDESVRHAKEVDIRFFQDVRDELDAHGFELVDWIQTDGAMIRSLTFTCDAAPRWEEDVE
jgi:hypothetical protein